MMVKKIIFCTRAQADGAWPNGTIVEKCEADPRDAHPTGARGKIIGSLGPVAEYEGHIMVYGYFVHWDDMPGLPIMTVSWKLRPLL
jgi:hypothetical protein